MAKKLIKSIAAHTRYCSLFRIALSYNIFILYIQVAKYLDLRLAACMHSINFPFYSIMAFGGDCLAF
jgi:hypothetical protein